MPAVAKPTVRSILVGLAACLTAEIHDTAGVKIPCRVMVTPGDAVTPEFEGSCDSDADDCGMGWVRLVSAYPAQGVGQQAVDSGNCNQSLGFTINMGIIRCFDPGDARSGPTAAEIEAYAFAQLEDMMLMRRAIQCCDALDHKDIILGNYTPLGPLGARIGGAWSLTGIL